MKTKRPLTRIYKRFEQCAAQNRPALITFITAGDPDQATSQAILDALPAAGADIIELGIPFSDPMAEGIPIQLATQRALKAGMTVEKILTMVRRFRQKDNTTPVILMGYYNPIYFLGPKAFVKQASEAGVDGLIVVDLPPEADDELCLPAIEMGLNFIRLATPTTDDARLPLVLSNISGFVYYVSMTGITGAELTNTGGIAEAVRRIKRHTDLPVAVGFGVKSANQARLIGKSADGVVVGSALVNSIGDTLDEYNKATKITVDTACHLVGLLAQGCKQARCAR